VQRYEYLLYFDQALASLQGMFNFAISEKRKAKSEKRKAKSEK